MEALGEMATTHLRAQVEAGVQAIQVFDSWAGALSPEDYERHGSDDADDLRFPGRRRADDSLRVGTGELLPLMRRAGGDVIGVDWRTPLDLAWERVGTDAAIQGISTRSPVSLRGRW